MLEEPFHAPVLAIFGVGLIGGSLSLGLKKHGAVDHVIGMGRSRPNLEKAVDLGVIDEIGGDMETVVGNADIIVLATPVGTMPDLLQEFLPHLRRKTIITDVGSVKQGIVDSARNVLGSQISQFVPGHPIAGKEHSGVAAASADLFQNHKVAITPLPETDALFCETICEMWRSVGAELVYMDVDEHDRVLSVTSHLPHILAYAMVDYFASTGDRDKCYEMVAGGFYDSTRTASSDPVMWRDICRMNRDEIIHSIQGYRRTLENITDLLEAGEFNKIEELFTRAKSARALVKEKRAV